jgi:hypothetical protein
MYFKVKNILKNNHDYTIKLTLYIKIKQINLVNL